MRNIFRILLIVIIIALMLAALYYLSNVIAYILIAGVLAFIGRPLMHRLGKLKIAGKPLPRSVNAALVLFFYLLVFAGFVGLFLPLIIQEINLITSLNYSDLRENIAQPLERLNNWLVTHNLLPAGQTLDDLLADTINKYLNVDYISKLFSNIIGGVAGFVTAVFAIAFITFFFLSEESLFYRMIIYFVPLRFHQKTNNALAHIKPMLTRYFGGIVLQLFIFGTLVFIGMSIIGVKYALLVGFFAGVLNIIPYVGPIIGMVFAAFVGLTTSVQGDSLADVSILLIKIVVVVLIVQMLDNFIFQPYIFSNSVKAHPLEIFLIILIAGTVSGVVGMVLAIPAYTILRVIAKEFLSEFGILGDTALIN